MSHDKSTGHVKKRIVLHFPGFEPLDAGKHQARYQRSALKTAKLQDFAVKVGTVQGEGRSRYFDVESEGLDWQTTSRVYLFDHDDLVRNLNDRSTLTRIAAGFSSAARVVWEGGALAYFRHAWRFGLFFVFPFLLVAIGLALSVLIGTAPYWLALESSLLIVSALAACLVFFKLFLPWSERWHTLHLFADWELAVAVASLEKLYFKQWVDECVTSVRAALEEPADEYVISSHSMGSSIAAQVIGALVERDPALFEGKRVVFVTLGGAILQCALLRCAEVLRARVGAIARVKEIFWFDVQCLTDAINFYRCQVVALAGHRDAPQPPIVFIRVKHLLSPERYRRIKRDFLRVHRQYVLDADVPASFDFTMMTAGPLPAASFATAY
ncbi:hypothetical protein JVX98_04810 (plasmid) [Ensifer sp. PDNC004]|uniref:hypothetical protein n=1 Tax=Ensifer sp. PDNC004 TaxID=2811423 RepID=UPI0019666EE5|nr:hypothetical protein [Ensifer sp. PDNC004]QRY64979.1 hypothetical protein JVX98_04810 [Ensifer sp. PDNC004]